MNSTTTNVIRSALSFDATRARAACWVRIVAVEICASLRHRCRSLGLKRRPQEPGELARDRHGDLLSAGPAAVAACPIGGDAAVDLRGPAFQAPPSV